MARRRASRRRRGFRWRWVILLLLLAVLAILITYPNRDPGALLQRLVPRTASSLTLVEPGHQLVTRGAPGWEYRRTLRVDLDLDGSEETIEVIARVSRVPGRSDEYQWDDGQPWQVYVVDGGRNTHIFARYVQLGKLDVLVTDESKPRLVIIEAQGAGYGVFSVEYDAPGEVTTRELLSVPVLDRTYP